VRPAPLTYHTFSCSSAVLCIFSEWVEDKYYGNIAAIFVGSFPSRLGEESCCGDVFSAVRGGSHGDQSGSNYSKSLAVCCWPFT
jgi:hypothetical protein